MRAKPTMMLLGVARLQLEEIALVDDLLDQLLHVVGLVGIGRHQRVERGLVAVGRIARSDAPAASARLDAGRKSMKRRSCSSASTSFSKARSATPERVVWVMAPPSSSWRYRLMRHRLHHIGAGDEHVGAVLHHEDEVGHRRRIDGAAGAGTHDQRDLRHDARGEHVALEDIGIARQRGDAFLDARAAAVVEADRPARPPSSPAPSPCRSSRHGLLRASRRTP